MHTSLDTRAFSFHSLFVVLVCCAVASCTPGRAPSAPSSEQPTAPAPSPTAPAPSPTAPPSAAAGHGAIVGGDPLPPLTARPDGRIIDAHAHLGGFDVWQDVRSVLDEVGIEYAFNLSGGSPRRGQTLAMMLAEDSGGRVVNFMSIDWGGVDEVGFGDVLAAELELLVTRYGYAGLKVSKALGLYVRDGTGQLIAVDDPRLFPLWEKAGALGVPVFIHTGDPKAFWDPVTPENERFAELAAHPRWSFASPEFPPRNALLEQRDHLLELFPETTWVGVHFGNNPEDLDYVERTLETHDNFYVDISARVPEIGRHDPERVRALFERFQDRILFATDIGIIRQRSGVSYTLGSSGPVPDTREDVGRFYDAHRQFLETTDRGITHPTPIQGDWTIDAIGLSQEVLDKIYYLNAYRLVLEGRRVVVDLPDYGEVP